MSQDERLTELESRVAFQEDTIDKMSTEMAHQEKQIAMLTRMVKIISSNLESMRGDPLSSAEDEPPPPHY